MRSNICNVLAGSLLLTLAAYAASEPDMVKDLAKCWDRSHEINLTVHQDEHGNSFTDPNYQKKMSNDARCYALTRQITKVYKHEYACFYNHKTLSYKCQHDIGGWK